MKRCSKCANAKAAPINYELEASAAFFFVLGCFFNAAASQSSPCGKPFALNVDAASKCHVLPLHRLSRSNLLFNVSTSAAPGASYEPETTKS